MHTTKQTTPQQAPALPTNRAFVVQFRAHTDEASPRWEGRVEHLVSGQATHFHSWTDLREFIAKILTSLSEQPP